MNETTLQHASARLSPRPGALSGLARPLVLSRLEQLQAGRLRLRDGNAVREYGDGDEPPVTVDVLDAAFYAEIAYGGSVGAGESYMLGHWDTDDLTGLLRLFLRNRATMDTLESGLARLSAPLRVLAHWLHRNTRVGSRRNIHAHYDLGNEFFRLMLDPTLMYSCALYERPDMSLADASVAKIDAICRKLQLTSNDHLLEIGTGWGGFALHAASRYGCRVTTTTISKNQFDLANARIAEAGLSERVEVLLEDYRDLEGTFDKLVSIEMIEAIGHQYFGEFFRVASARLKPGGRMLLQSITIAEPYYVQARDGVDFIKRYIFPGCCIPSVGALTQAMAAGDLRLEHLEDIGPHYATTLAHWRDNFEARIDEVRALGYPETFCRMWTYYLCYCEAGFAERTLGDAQLLLTR
jgi:cyclopropane-fatty-acyl-phospholipid synthase